MLTLTYQVFAALCGWLEAILYGERGAESFSSNEHTGMMLQRIAALLVVLAGVLVYYWFGWRLLLAELVPLVLLFPMCHDEAYNFTRLWITATNNATIKDSLAWTVAWHTYQYGYQSPTTTARNDFNGTARTWLALAGGVLLVSLYVLHFFHLLPFHA